MAGEALRKASDEDHLAYHLEHDYTLLDLDDREREILEYAAKLAAQPHLLSESDVEPLIGIGLSENQLVELAAGVMLCCFNVRCGDIGGLSGMNSES